MDKIFAEGIYFNEKNANAPEFILGSISVIPGKLVDWIMHQTPNEKGYVKMAIKKSKGGKIYIELDNWVPKQGNQTDTQEDAGVQLNKVPY